MTHVVHLTSVHYPFDPRIFHKQLRTLSEAGYQTTLVAHHEKSMVRDGIRIVSLGEVTSRTQRWRNLRRLYKTAVDLNAAVYHFHDPELLPIGVVLSKRTDAAVIYDIHEDYADAIRVREWIPEHVKPVLARGFPALQSAFASRFDAIVTADESTQAEMHARGHDSVIALRNFPRIDDIEIGEAEIDRDHELVLAYVGGLDRERGLMRMLRLTARLQQRGIDVGLWLLGPFQDDEIEREARSFAVREGITNHVRLFGYVDYSDIFAYLAHADIGLLLADEARFERNVPTKFFEYMYSELPVISTEIPSIAEFRSPGYCITVPEGDIEQTTESVSELLNDPDRIREMGKRGREKVKTEYNWELEKEKLLQTYRQLVDKK